MEFIQEIFEKKCNFKMFVNMYIFITFGFYPYISIHHYAPSLKINFPNFLLKF